MVRNDIFRIIRANTNHFPDWQGKRYFVSHRKKYDISFEVVGSHFARGRENHKGNVQALHIVINRKEKETQKL